ncbi:MAG: phosphotransferase family protein [Deltaproteobacteria bacterium]|nr:phosphotransferase family protein [Deltaproteobacteria bacterium]
MDAAAFQRFTAWAEHALGGKVVRAERQGERRSGGRPAWFLDVARGGEVLACYARMDRGAEQLISREFTLEREHRVLRALGEAGARVPRVYGFCRDPAGILMERVRGDFDYTQLAPGSARDALDDDFLRELVRVHQLDPARFVAAGIESPASAEQTALHDLALWERAYRRALVRPVPVVEFATRWLRRNLPAPPQRLSLVQGDTGPGQFLFDMAPADSARGLPRATAIIDWEFAHLGDPVLDLAQIRTRDFYNPGIDLARWLVRYEQLSGSRVDRRKLAYYTVKSMAITPLALAGMVQHMHPRTDHAEWFAQDVCYKRATAEALCEAIGAPATPPELPAEAVTERSAIFDVLEENLRDEHKPAAPDDYARYRLDLARRLARHLRNADAFGAALEAEELQEIARLTGAKSRTLAEGDAALTALIAANEGARDYEIAAYLYRRAVRDEALWRGALGAGEKAVYQRLR